MLTELCGELRNWFIKNSADVYAGTYTISDGATEALSFLQNGQYFRVVGSVFNDGVWQYPASGMTDEVFDGEIWAMRVPREVIELSNAIDDWVADNAAALDSPYQSESFGGYSYSLKSGGSGADGGTGAVTWKSQFASKLSKWRKL